MRLFPLLNVLAGHQLLLAQAVLIAVAQIVYHQDPLFQKAFHAHLRFRVPVAFGCGLLLKGIQIHLTDGVLWSGL